MIPSLVEPPVGTVAEFYRAFKGGGGDSSNLLVRTIDGWSNNISGRDARSWQELTDLNFMNAQIQRNHPGSSASFAAVEICIVAGPGVTSWPSENQ